MNSAFIIVNLCKYNTYDNCALLPNSISIYGYLHICYQWLVPWEIIYPFIYNQECPTLESQSTAEQNEVVVFIERVSQEEDLVGDGSTSHSLPTIPGKHADLKSITTDTVRAYLQLFIEIIQ